MFFLSEYPTPVSEGQSPISFISQGEYLPSAGLWTSVSWLPRHAIQAWPIRAASPWLYNQFRGRQVSQSGSSDSEPPGFLFVGEVKL